MAGNKSLVVSTWYDCEGNVDLNSMVYDPSWRHNMIGCFLIQILKNLYGVNVTYIKETPATFYANRSTDVDLYAMPVVLSPEILAFGFPIQAVIHSRYGFIVRRPHDIGLWNRYYLRPFTVVLWRILLLVAVVVCCVFFITSWWEQRVFGTTECSIWLEILVTIGGYCQHIPSVETIFYSRRAAYFTFFLYTYIIYTVYTSNLLSHLVSDKEHDIGLNYLETECFEFAVLQYMKHFLVNDYIKNSNSAFFTKLYESEAVPLSSALNAVRWNRTALLSDYITIYPLVQAAFTEAEICELVEVDLNSDVKKYIVASTRFKHREQLKIGILRVQEAGILSRMTYYDNYHPLKCETVLHQEVKIEQIFTPLMLLMVTFGISTVIMLLERMHHQRNRVWPFVN